MQEGFLCFFGICGAVSRTAGAFLVTAWAQGAGQLTPTAGIVAFCVLCIAQMALGATSVTANNGLDFMERENCLYCSHWVLPSLLEGIVL